jgi:hypothetical protein
MVLETQHILKNLMEFYDFRNKVIISVGSDGMQLVGYGRTAKYVIAINSIPDASESLNDIVRYNNLEDKYKIVTGNFPDMNVKGDVILFEFSLHKMNNPSEILEKSLSRAIDVIVLDHWIDSEWVYYTGGEVKVFEEWKAIRSLSPVKSKSFSCLHLFPKYEDLENKLMHYGTIGQERIHSFKNKTNITIVMHYNIALLSR